MALNFTFKKGTRTSQPLHEYGLDGIAMQPLGSYLTGLGLLRCLNRTIDPDAKAFWRDDAFILQSSIPKQKLVESVMGEYKAIRIYSPWNADAGIATQDGQAQFIEGSTGEMLGSSPCKRLDGMSVLLEEILDVCRHFSIRSKDQKLPIIDALFNRIIDLDWQQWANACVVLFEEKGKLAARFPKMLGTGGNVGKVDLACNYVSVMNFSPQIYGRV